MPTKTHLNVRIEKASRVKAVYGRSFKGSIRRYRELQIANWWYSLKE